MEPKKKYQINNHGKFNLFGYEDLTLPGIVELTPQQVIYLEKIGYTLTELDESVFVKNSRNLIRTVNASKFKKTFK